MNGDRTVRETPKPPVHQTSRTTGTTMISNIPIFCMQSLLTLNEPKLSHSRRRGRWSARRASELPRRWNGPAGRLLAPASLGGVSLMSLSESINHQPNADAPNGAVEHQPTNQGEPIVWQRKKQDISKRPEMESRSSWKRQG